MKNPPDAAFPHAWPKLWPSIPILALGICAGMQLAKIAPVIPRLQAEASLRLPIAGWLTSLLGLIGTIARAGGIATLAGPPQAGLIAESFGWPPLSWSFAAVGLLAAAIIATDSRRGHSKP